MDLRQLNALLAVADHHSFSAAARALHTVQSNVSTHVARLEKELGATLVERGSGTLTDAGTLVVNRARRIHIEMDAIASDVAALLGEVSGAVRLGVIGTTGRWLVPPLLTTLAEAHPKVRLVTIDATTTSLIPQLTASLIDMAVVNLPVHDPDVDVRPMFEEEHRILAPVGHPLAKAKTFDLGGLGEIPLLLEPPGTGFRDDLDADAARLSIELVPQAEVDGMRLLASLAYQGHGAAILPASAISDWSDGSWRAIPLTGTTPRAVGIATSRRGRPSAAAEATMAVLEEVIAREVPNHVGLHLLAGAVRPSQARDGDEGLIG